jgi:hypothetical protein
MTPEELLNHTMLKKYVTKHYRICKIRPTYPLSKKLSHKVEYSIFDIENDAEKTLWHFKSYLCKIFTVDISAVNKTLNELVQEELAKLRAQTTLDFERNNTQIPG